MKKVQEKLINFVKKGQYKGLCELIEKEKIDLNFKDNYGTPLTHLAVSHPDILEYLLNHGTRIDLIDQYGNTALHEAAIKGISDSIQLLIKRGANINFQNHWQATPLPLSAQFNKINSMKLLLDYGAEVNCYNFEHNSPMEIIFELYINARSLKQKQIIIESIKVLVAYNGDTLSAINGLSSSPAKNQLQDEVNKMIIARNSLNELLTNNINKSLSIDQFTIKIEEITERMGQEFASRVAKCIALRILSEPISMGIKDNISKSNLQEKIQDLSWVCNSGKIINRNKDYVLLTQADKILREFKCNEESTCLSLFYQAAITINWTLLTSANIPKEVKEKCLSIHNVINCGNLSILLDPLEEPIKLVGNCD